MGSSEQAGKQCSTGRQVVQSRQAEQGRAGSQGVRANQEAGTLGRTGRQTFRAEKAGR
jgi:hypothetical protein